jgi:hypothetical protein
VSTIQPVADSHFARAAFEYARFGLRLIPSCSPHHGRCRYHGLSCTSPGKVPLVKWTPFQSRAPTEQELRTWWWTWPQANLSIVCGYPVQEHLYLVVVDIEEEGVEAFWKTQPPRTPTYASQGHGVHLWFTTGQPLKARRLEINGKFIGDLRGYGSLATIPPSAGVKGWYQWYPGLALGEVGIATLPLWLTQVPDKPEGDRYNLAVHGIRLLKNPHPIINQLPLRTQRVLLGDDYRCLDRSRFDAKVVKELVELGVDDQTIQDVLLWPRGSKAQERLQLAGPSSCKEYVRRTIAWARKTPRVQTQG